MASDSQPACRLNTFPGSCPRWWGAMTAAGAAAVLALVSACSGGYGRVLVPAVSRSCDPGVNAAEFWIMGAGELGRLEAAAPRAVRHAIKAANLYVLELAGKTSPVGQTVADFRSYAGFAAAIAAHAIPRTTHWVLYDNERWPQTPVIEQRNPAHYEALFTTLAASHGFNVILAPGQDLVYGFSGSRLPPGDPMWQRYLSARLAAASGRLADIYEIQAQPYELPMYRPSSAYVRFVRAAAAQARAVAPHVAIFAGLSTNRVAGAAQLLQDYNAVRGTVSGFWLNIPHSGRRGPLKLAARFLSRLPAAVAAGARTCA